jgi:hypothetical protein
MIRQTHVEWPTPHLAHRASPRLVLALLVPTLLAGLLAVTNAQPADASSRQARGAVKAWASATTTTTKPATAPAPTTTVAPTTTTTARPAVSSTTTPTTVAPTTTTTAPAATPATTGGGRLFGAATEGGSNGLSGLTTFETDAGRKVSLYSYYNSFYYSPDFDTAAADAVRARGAVPMITWEPWDPRTGSANQPAYSLSALASGAHDAYLTRWAKEVKAWGQPLWLRFAHEMNSDWYPWAASVNGNTAAQYVAAWRHVHDIFVREGATNVAWVWSPNVEFPGSTPLASLYPGDGYVDWLGVDGYNWGTSTSWGSWQTPTEVFGPTLASLRRLSSRPIVIGETASTEVGGSKAQYIQQFFSMLGSNPDIRAFVWFNLNKETDWRIESSAAARQAFATGVAGY